MAKRYKKKKEPIKYAITFDGVEYSKDDRSFLWRQLVSTLTKLHQSNVQN